MISRCGLSIDGRPLSCKIQNDANEFATLETSRREIMRMGGMALPAGNRDDLPLNQYEYMGGKLAEDKRIIQNEIMGR